MWAIASWRAFCSRSPVIQAQLGAGQDLLACRFVLGQGPVVEVGSVVQVIGLPRGVDLHVQHAAGDDPFLPAGA